MTDPNLTPGTDSGGNYDAEVTAARDATGAALAMLIIVGGTKGNGFSVQALAPELLATIPRVLRNVAAAIERGEAQGGPWPPSAH